MNRLPLLIALFFMLGCQHPPDRIEMRTEMGTMIFRLSEGAPLHKANFLSELENGTWADISFNRMVPNFVIQAGCPDREDGTIDAAHWIDGEFADSLTHRFGALGMGRDANPEKRSANCQFYIVTHPEGVHRLDGDYTVFGQLLEGHEVLRRINEAVVQDSIGVLSLKVSSL